MNDALAFARWLQSIEIQIIGEDVNLAALYGQYIADVEPYCNHDAPALTPVMANQCECGAVIAEMAW